MGDRPQLLSLMLVAQYGRPWSIMVGSLAATIANHALATAYANLTAVVLDTTAGKPAANFPIVLLKECLCFEAAVLGNRP